MTPLIAIDCRFGATRSGLGRYTRELVRHMVSEGTEDRFALLVRDEREEWIPHAPNVSVVRCDIPHYSIAEQIKLPALIRSLRADLFFSPHFNVPMVCPVSYVVTIHDLILHRYPNAASLPRKIAYRILIRRALRSARRVLTISNFVACEVKDVYGIDAFTIHEGVDPTYAPRSGQEYATIKRKYNIAKPYFLYVGNAKQHKNVKTLIDAFSSLNDSSKELVLVSGGKELERLMPLPSGVRVVPDVPDEDLPLLYGASHAFVTASLYEGFCLPVAEALACGCPVLASNTTAIPEVAAGHATLVEPTVTAFAQAMRQEPKKTIPFVVSTWSACAKSTLDALRDALNK